MAVLGPTSSSGQAILPPLFREHFSRDGENSFETFSALDGILFEALDTEVLDCRLDLLPSTTERNDFGLLLEDSLA